MYSPPVSCQCIDVQLVCIGVQLVCTGVQLVCIGVQLVCIGVQLVCIGVQLVCIGVQLVCIGVQLVCIGVQLVCIGVQLSFSDDFHAFRHWQRCLHTGVLDNKRNYDERVSAIMLYHFFPAPFTWASQLRFNDEVHQVWPLSPPAVSPAW